MVSPGLSVDSHSKYPGAIPLSTTTANSTINALLDVFSHFGYPEQIVFDYGPPFDSSYFAGFCNTYGIRHSRSSPYHPKTNGEAERYVQTFKDALPVANADNTTVRRLESEFLLRYRVTRHSTTGTAPAQVLLARAPRIELDLLHQDTETLVRRHLEADQQRFDERAKDQQFAEGHQVFARSYAGDSDGKPESYFFVLGQYLTTFKLVKASNIDMQLNCESESRLCLKNLARRKWRRKY